MGEAFEFREGLTMGFWQTGYFEFHEPTGLGDYKPKPRVYRCEDCGAPFPLNEELRAHRFERHPHCRPMLFLRGHEVGTTSKRITTLIKGGDIQVEHCEQAQINGKSVGLSTLGKKLSAKMDDTVTVVLKNKYVEATFNLCFEISQEEDLAGVEQCFLNMARGGSLDKDTIEIFIKESDKFSTASRYCDGICQYCYGVLAKECSPDSSLPLDKYIEKFNQAANELRDFDRRLSIMICALIAFHFNQFRVSADLERNSRVGRVSARFEQWVAGSEVETERHSCCKFDSRLDEFLTDHESEKIIQWCMDDSANLSDRLSEIESFMRQSISEFNRTKLRVLLAEHYADQRCIVEAKKHARLLRNNPSFGAWSENLLHRLMSRDQHND